MEWKPHFVAEPTLEEIRRTRRDFETMLAATLDAVIERYERLPDYHFIDTKFSLITGEDFEQEGDPRKNIKGRHVVYSWVQGRGLEALAGHAEWLPECGILSEGRKRDRIGRIRRLLAEVVDSMERLRRRNSGQARPGFSAAGAPRGGHSGTGRNETLPPAGQPARGGLAFMMRPDGTPLSLDGEGSLSPAELRPEETTFSDLFYAKGLAAASRYLGLDEKFAEAEQMLTTILADIESGRFVSGQAQLDPKNKVAPVPGRRTHAYRMIALGALHLLFRRTGDGSWLAKGEEFIRYLLEKHLSRGRFEGLHELDYVEFIDDRSLPWREPDGEVLCDPGHVLEMIGLATRLLRIMTEAGHASQRQLAAECAHLLPRLFDHVFDLGFNREKGGIYKAVGLVNRRPINDDMPWWSLPETLRAGMELYRFTPDRQAKPRLLRAVADCTNALLQHYVNPRAHLMAYQTRSAAGEPVDVIPGMPDADPGYHTGLSVIDFLRLL